MRSLLLLGLGMVAAMAAPVLAQDAASVHWALTEADGQGVSSTEGAATGIPIRSEGIVVRSYSGTLSDGSGGPLGPYQRWWLDGAEWPIESAPNEDRYVEFVVAPGPDATFTVTAVSLVMNAAGTGEMDARLAYDTDTDFSDATILQDNVDISRDAVGNFSFVLDEALRAGDSLYVRVYPWLGGGNPSSGRYLLLQDVTVSGTSTGDAPPPPPPPPPSYSDYVTWDLAGDDTTAVSSTAGFATGTSVRAQSVVVRDYTGTLQDGATGPLGPFQRWWLGGAVWPVESGPDASRYVEFVVAPAEGATLRVTNIDILLNAGGTGELDASVFYATDAAFTNPTSLLVAADVPRDTVGDYAFVLDQMLNDGDSLYVRVYPWLGGGDASAERYLFLQNVTIGGVGEEIADEPPVGVTWPLTAADTTSAARVAENLSGSDVRGEGIMIRDYTGALQDDSEGPLGPFQRWWLDDVWPDEAAPNSDRYIEFVAAADEGFAFALDSLSLTLNGQGTGNMEASLYYSTDPAFSDPVALAEGVAASREAIGYFSFPLDTVVPEGDAVYFRVYPYLPGGSTSAGKYLLLQDVTIAGAAVVPYEAEGVFWALTEAYKTSVAATGEHLVGASATGTNLQVRDYDGDLRDAGDAPGPLGLFQRWWIGADMPWPVEDGEEGNPAGPNAARYVQFAATPEAGYAFRVDSLSAYVHGDGTSEMRAAIYYSTSPTFADSVALGEEFQAGDGDFGGPTLRTYDLSLDVLPGDSIYVRVYPWVGGGNPSAGRYLLLQALTIHGTAIDANSVDAEGSPEPGRFVLHPSAPNPARSRATLRYELGEATDVQVHLVNVLGQRLATLVSGPQPAGAHDVTVETEGLAAGVYFVRLLAGGEALTRQITVAR